MKNWKKNLVAAAVLITVCGGIYLNWMYSEDQATADLTDTLDANKILSEDTLVLSQDDDLMAVDADTGTADDYFAAIRLSRQEARDSAVTLLQEAIAYTGGEAKDDTTTAQLEDIVQTALCESQIESLVIAKGYTDCVAYISEEGISIAVASPEGGLQQQDVAVIADIVLSQSDFTMDDIHVVEVQ